MSCPYECKKKRESGDLAGGFLEQFVNQGLVRLGLLGGHAAKPVEQAGGNAHGNKLFGGAGDAAYFARRKPQDSTRRAAQMQESKQIPHTLAECASGFGMTRFGRCGVLRPASEGGPYSTSVTHGRGRRVCARRRRRARLRERRGLPRTARR